jgi:hypothetical protein
MDKPRYEKPIVLDLNGNSANGAPLWCGSGNSVSSGVCYTGVGGTADPSDCKSGGTANAGGACVSGSVAAYECSAGISDSGAYQNSCTSGPTPTP